MSSGLLLTALLCGLAASAPAFAEIYECLEPDGNKIYTDQPKTAKERGCKPLPPGPPNTPEKLDAEQRARDKARIGMTKEQALAAGWGKPARVNRTRTASGTFEQWRYPENRTYEFKNGVLTAIHD